MSLLRMLFVIGLFCSHSSSAQLVNGAFELWDTISMFGQPYINPAGWVTNNNNTFAGLANTPVTQGIDSTGFYAIVASKEWGLDAVLPGRLKQTIRSRDLKRIEYFSKCDSLYQTGTCDINIYRGESNNLVYTESIVAEDTVFQLRSIDILPEWIQGEDSVTIEFVANGILDMWDEQEDGYAVFLVDQVDASYISSTDRPTETAWITCYPNPTTGNVTLDPGSPFARRIDISDLSGKMIRSFSDLESIDLEGLAPGMYIIRIVDVYGRMSLSKVIKAGR